MKVMVAVSEPTDVEVRTLPLALSTLVIELTAGLVVVLVPQAMAEVNTTGVNLGSDEMGSPWSGASMIHSQVLPLKSAPGGGARVMEKCFAGGVVDEGERDGDMCGVLDGDGDGVAGCYGHVGDADLIDIGRGV